jgi:hypothetical protein
MPVRVELFESPFIVQVERERQSYMGDGGVDFVLAIAFAAGNRGFHIVEGDAGEWKLSLCSPQILERGGHGKKRDKKEAGDPRMLT